MIPQETLIPYELICKISYCPFVRRNNRETPRGQSLSPPLSLYFPHAHLPTLPVIIQHCALGGMMLRPSSTINTQTDAYSFIS